MKTDRQIRAEFDRIARLSEPAAESPGLHQGYLLRHAPATMASALDVGCGMGVFTRELARRAGRVLAIDLSPVMVEIARRRSGDYPNIDYAVADAMVSDLPIAHFDCVASLEALHHMPLRAILGRIIAALKPGGVLLIADQAEAGGLATLPRRLLRRIVRTLARREPVSSDLSEAWAEHWRGDTRPRVSEVKAVAAELMPGAKVTSHPHSTYSIVWRKP